MINSESYDVENITASYIIDSWWYKIDKAYVDTITSGEGEQKIRGLLKVKWDKNPSLELVFDQNTSGTILIESIRLQ